MAKDKKWAKRWDLLLRYRAIEIIALWEGRLTTNHLCDTFGIGRQQASKDINSYNGDTTPRNLEYDKSLKGYKPTAVFKPIYTTGAVDEYLHLLNRNSDLNKTFASLQLQTANTEVLNAPIRKVAPEVIRNIVLAARQCRRIEVDYVSLSHPNREGRIIVPHTIVFTGLRWHVRAWCEKNLEFRDFVLSRFRGVPEIMDISDQNVSKDKDWNTKVKVKLKPNPALTPLQRRVVAEDYDMNKSRLIIEVRGTLIKYLFHQLRVEAQAKGPPESHPVVIDNDADVYPWLFGESSH